MTRFSIVTLVLVLMLLMGCLVGGVWVWAALSYISVFAYAVDRLAPFMFENAPVDAEFPAATPLSVVLAISHFVILALAIHTLTGSQAGFFENCALFLAVGLFAGQVGHPNAHELIHRPQRGLRRLGRGVYMTILMGHHASAHPLVHHVHVGTEHDPVSAPKGRGFWRYLRHASLGSYRAGYVAERKRRRGQGVHPYVQYHLGAGVTLLCAFALGGWSGIGLCILLGLYAQFQVLLSDYVQHYGLRRKMLENGKLEPVAPHHSWNTPHRFSGAMMLNAPRHSDHHTHPSRAYPKLQLVAEEMPLLPYSLPMMASIALIPPLWRRIMDPRVAEWERRV